MTTRLKGFVVALSDDLRDDDAESVRQAILALRYVVSVAPVPTDISDHINREVVRREYITKILDVLK